MLRVSWVGCLVFYLFVLGTDWLIDALDPSHASLWPPLYLFLADIYSHPSSQRATTSSSHHASHFTTSSSPPPQNPITLDELTAFLRKLLNIAFTLYWREDRVNVLESLVPEGSGRALW
jgi:ubiquitin-protein ligase E3 C